MRPPRHVSLTAICAAAVILAACRQKPVSTPQGGVVRVRDCEGPARSLDPGLAAALPPRTGAMHPDDQWADLAARVPGGFAGILFDEDGQTPIIMLTRPEEAAQAKAALAAQLPSRFPIRSAIPRPARWDFAQLVDWYNYLMPKVFRGGVVLGDKSEGANRIVFGVVADSTRRRVVRELNALDIPCDLVHLEIRGRPILLERSVGPTVQGAARPPVNSTIVEPPPAAKPFVPQRISFVCPLSAALVNEPRLVNEV